MLIRADARHLPLSDACVQCCVTSPPYWGLRDYGIVGQLGLESTPDAYVAQIVAVFREVRRVLKDDGTVWLNLGDSYAANRSYQVVDNKHVDVGNSKSSTVPDGLKPKDLVGIPWRVAFALQADGWYLRSDIIWHKPNPMPESVTDRPTKAHEYLFLLTKAERYYYDAEAIAEASTGQDAGNGFKRPERLSYDGRGDETPWTANPAGTRNRRSVWTIPTLPYAGAHFATMPEALVQPCILAGSRLAGKRCDCDEVIASPEGSGPIDDPSFVTGRAGFNRPRRADEGTRPVTRREQRSYAAQIRLSAYREEMQAEAGEAFAHYIRTDASGARPPRPDLLRRWLAHGWLREPEPCRHPIEPADLVLDPFSGSGTVLDVAQRHGRRAVGCDLNPAYHVLAQARTAQRGFRFDQAVSAGADRGGLEQP